MEECDDTNAHAVYGKAGPRSPRPAGWRATACRLAACGLLFAAMQAHAGDAPASDINYRLGEGLRIADTGLSLGGYATASLSKLRDAPTRVALDNLSLFVWWQNDGRWKFFSELDFENVLASSAAGQEGEDHYLALERLYLDYAISDTTTLRAGKFLTPIGRWNQIHATPLVWTTSRPLVTVRTFPTNATGLMLNGTLPGVAGGLDYSLYASKDSEIRPNPALDPFNEALGAHLNLALSDASQLGLSYAAFEQDRTPDERKRLAGVDFRWARKRWEFSAEGVYRFSDRGSARDEKGAFAQLVAPLSDKLYGVARYELFRKAGESVTTRLGVAGLNYRVTPAIVLKAEWIDARGNRVDAPEGFMSSLSVLF